MLSENLASGSERNSCGNQYIAIRCLCEPPRKNTYNIVIFHLIGLSPGAHDEGVIRCDDSDNLDALFLQLGQVLDVSGNVVDGAGGGESA